MVGLTENKANPAAYARTNRAAKGRVVGMSVQKVWWGKFIPGVLDHAILADVKFSHTE